MYFREFIFVFGVVVRSSSENKCIFNTPFSWNYAHSFFTTLTNRPFSRQCKHDDLTTITAFGQLDHSTFWIGNGGFCTNYTCEALVFNSTDDEASTSIMCLNCTEEHGVVGDEDSKPCESTELSARTSHSTCTQSCSDLWIPVGNKEFFISPVRRNMPDSQEWCLSKNGTALDHWNDLKIVHSMTLPQPILKTYWVGVTISDYKNGEIGAILTTRNRGVHLTQKFNIDSASRGEFNNKYGCICIRKIKQSTTPKAITTAGSTTTPTTTKATTNAGSMDISFIKPTPTKGITTVGSTNILIPTASTTNTIYTSTQTSKQRAEVLTGKYKNILTVNGLMKKSGVAQQVRAKRSLECAMNCDRTSGCKGYFFDEKTSLCQLVDGTNLKQHCNNVPTAKYYQKQ